jgi:DNA-directed RNA polymerase III subunit RPC11
MHRFFCQTCP